MLAGQGPKMFDIPWPQPQITQANYKQYARPGWTVTTPGTVEQPRSTHYSEKDMNSLFTHPERKAKGFDAGRPWPRPARARPRGGRRDVA